MNNNHNSTLNGKSSSSFKRKYPFQNDSCTFERQLETPRQHKVSKQKDISMNIANHRTPCCVTQLFHPKSIVYIQDEENRLFSIVSLRTPQTDEELLTQRTEEYVDQIFDLMMHHTVTNDTNQYWQAELVLLLDTQSQLIKMQTSSNSFRISK